MARVHELYLKPISSFCSSSSPASAPLYRMDVYVCKNGVTGRARCRCRARFMRRPEVCLDPSTTGEHVAYIPAVSSTLTGSLSLSLSLSHTPNESRCHTVPALNTSSWPRPGWQEATGLTQSLQVIYARLCVCACGVCVCVCVC